ncbi:sugar phosphate isomerase/epimerase family protein [Streptomyces griseus]
MTNDDGGGDLSRLSINQETLKQWSLPDLAEGCVKAGIDKVGLWRAPVQEYGVERTARLLADAGIEVTSLCRGGFFTALDPAERARALDDNRAAIDEAAALSTDTLVLVSGGLPPRHAATSMGPASGVGEALAELAPYAADTRILLAEDEATKQQGSYRAPLASGTYGGAGPDGCGTAAGREVSAVGRVRRPRTVRPGHPDVTGATREARSHCPGHTSTAFQGSRPEVTRGRSPRSRSEHRNKAAAGAATELADARLVLPSPLSSPVLSLPPSLSPSQPRSSASLASASPARVC